MQRTLIVSAVLALLAVAGALGYQYWELPSFGYGDTQEAAVPIKHTDSEEAEAPAAEGLASAVEPMIIGTTPVYASIADERDERTQGLSGVPRMLPDEVKLFVFPYDEKWSFWMKDMLFSIDMIWVDASSTVVYIEEEVSPESFPKSFRPTKPARYVVETVAGFSEEHNIGVGDKIILPESVAN